MNSAERERINLLNVNMLMKKFIEVLSTVAIEVRATPEDKVDPQEVHDRLDREIKKVISGYPGGLRKLGIDFHIYTQVAQQMRITLIQHMTEYLFAQAETHVASKEVSQEEKAKAIGDLLEAMLGFKK